MHLNSVLNREASRRQTMFGAKLVHQLRCQACDNKLCSRAMKALLLADTKTELYSTDVSPLQGCAPVGKPYATKSCDCKISDVACTDCGSEVGYHVVHPCMNCLKACNNGHFWMFHGRCVKASERADSKRNSHLTWASIPSAATDLVAKSPTPKAPRMVHYEAIECIR